MALRSRHTQQAWALCRKIQKLFDSSKSIKQPIKAAFFKAAFIGLRIERKSNSCLRITMAILYPGGNQL
ncbi:MAG TPA: hypothetical protein DHN18_00045 [Oscillibacter sp.]|nr:hypothetical protein [Oscillibacter sp.]